MKGGRNVKSNIGRGILILTIAAMPLTIEVREAAPFRSASYNGFPSSAASGESCDGYSTPSTV